MKKLFIEFKPGGEVVTRAVGFAEEGADCHAAGRMIEELFAGPVERKDGEEPPPLTAESQAEDVQARNQERLA